MPPRSHFALHPSARLSLDDKRVLAQGLNAISGAAAVQDD
jgi:hypothetical protein